MKKLILCCGILLCTLNNTQAQNAPLNTQQTLDYIEKLFKASYRYVGDPTRVVTNVTLDFKTLQVNHNNGRKFRTLLDDDRLLKVSFTNDDKNDGYKISFEGSEHSILYLIQNESDANRLKNALTHLIEILKAEKSTDPFGN